LLASKPARILNQNTPDLKTKIRFRINGKRSSNATALGPQGVGSADLEFAVRQLVEVAVRALSPGVNDPHTAMSVLDRLGAGLCDIVPLHLPNGVHLRDDRVVLMVPAIQYDGLLDAMFHMIRQAAASDAAVLIRNAGGADVERQFGARSSPHGLAAASCQSCRRRRRRNVHMPQDLADVERRYLAFVTMREDGPLGQFRSG
jgi:uncharacterized membrane protein